MEPAASGVDGDERVDGLFAAVEVDRVVKRGEGGMIVLVGMGQVICIV